MKFQLLPSTFDDNGGVSPRQHLSCFVIDNCVAIDAGSLAMASSFDQKRRIRDVVLTHAHLDHIAGLPLFIDDLFAVLTEPVRLHATPEVIDVLRKNVFNWNVYPSFSELSNENGPVLEYHPFEVGEPISVKHLKLESVNVNHKVPAVGFIISDDETTIALSSDTAEMSEFWSKVNEKKDMRAVLVECAFPNELEELARVSHHLTPASLRKELNKLELDCPIYVINLKPMYRDEIVVQLNDLRIDNLEVLEVGLTYDW